MAHPRPGPGSSAVAEVLPPVRLGARAWVGWTTRADGHLLPPAAGALSLLAARAGRPVAWARQVHGDRALVVDGPSWASGQEGDALVTASTEVALAVFTADCAPVALASDEGVVAAVHAGWRGLASGVVQSAVDAMRAVGATAVSAAIGPCIHAECYPFSPADLAPLVARFGPAARGTAADGSPALDLPGALGVALDRAGVEVVAESGDCTACAPDRYFSHRAHGDVERQALVVWTG